jgi:hypothetical protein
MSPQGKSALTFLVAVAVGLGVLAVVYVIFSHLSGPKAGESCGQAHHWVYIGEAKNFSCVQDR